jgi:hypothetical protein
MRPSVFNLLLAIAAACLFSSPSQASVTTKMEQAEIFRSQFQKIQALRNRRLHDPSLPSTVPPALEMQLNRRAQEEPLGQEMSHLLDKARMRSAAMHRLESKMRGSDDASKDEA